MYLKMCNYNIVLKLKATRFDFYLKVKVVAKLSIDMIVKIFGSLSKGTIDHNHSWHGFIFSF